MPDTSPLNTAPPPPSDMFPKLRARLPRLETETQAPVASRSLGVHVSPPTCSHWSVHWPFVGSETLQKSVNNLAASSRISLAVPTLVTNLLRGAKCGPCTRDGEVGGREGCYMQLKKIMDKPALTSSINLQTVGLCPHAGREPGARRHLFIVPKDRWITDYERISVMILAQSISMINNHLRKVYLLRQAEGRGSTESHWHCSTPQSLSRRQMVPTARDATWTFLSSAAPAKQLYALPIWSRRLVKCPSPSADTCEP